MDAREASTNHFISSHMDDHIHIVTGAGGPKARIRGSRIRVVDILAWWEHGRTVDDIVTSFPQLSKADVFAALAYYWDQKAEIGAKIAADDAFADEMRRRDPGPLASKLAQRAVG